VQVPSRPRPETVWGYAAFLQNAPVVHHTRGFTPGWYAVPRWGTPNASPPPQHARRSGIGPQRALEAITKNPSRKARKPHPPQSFLSERRTGPAELTNTPGGGAVTTTPRNGLGVCGVPSERSGCAPYPGFHPGLVCGAPLGHSERPSSPAPAPQHTCSPTIIFPHGRQSNHPIKGHAPNTPGGAGSIRSEHRNVLTLFPLAHSAKAPSSPEPSCERRTDPAEPTPIRQAERDRSKASIEGDHPNPSRTARKLLPPPSLPANAGPIPRSPPPPQRPGQSL